MDTNETAQPAPEKKSGSWIKNKKIVVLAVSALLAVLAVIIAVYFLVLPARDSQVSGRVSVTENGFLPQTIEVKEGQSVTWTNAGEGLYYVLGDAPEEGSVAGFDSGGSLHPGDTFTYKFEESGTYTYHDRENPLGAKGTVIVTD